MFPRWRHMSKKLQDDRMLVGIPWFLNVSAMSIGHQNGFQDASTCRKILWNSLGISVFPRRQLAPWTHQDESEFVSMSKEFQCYCAPGGLPRRIETSEQFMEFLGIFNVLAPPIGSQDCLQAVLRCTKTGWNSLGISVFPRRQTVSWTPQDD